MRCTYCGCEFADNLSACPRCGAVLSATYGNATHPRPPYPTAVEIIRATAKHKLFLTATILVTVFTAIMALSFSFRVNEILIAIGAWMLFAEGRKLDADPFTMSTASLKVLKASKIVLIVALWIIAVCFGISFLLILVAALILGEWSELIDAFVSGFAGSAGINSNGTIDMPELMDVLQNHAVLIFTLSLVLITSLLIYYFIYAYGMKNYFNSAIKSAKTGLRPEKLPSAAPIMLIINSSFSILSCISSNIDALTLLASIGNCVGMIMFAVILLDAKKRSESSYYPSEAEAAFYMNAYYYSKNQSIFGQHYNADPTEHQFYQQTNNAQQQQHYGQPNNGDAWQNNAQPANNDTWQNNGQQSNNDIW